MKSSIPGKPHDLVSYTGAFVVAVGVAYYRLDPPSVSLASLSLGQLGLLLWSCHFLRRITECAFVHRYAGRQVPWGDALGEYAYYWGFGAWNAWASCSEIGTHWDVLGLVGAALFVSGELGNSWSHLKLRALRRPDTNDRGLPRGGLFEWVSCPNYTYEILSWIGFAVAIRTYAAWAFVLAVLPILLSWAKKRHARYHELFNGSGDRQRYPAQRRALIPGVF